MRAMLFAAIVTILASGGETALSSASRVEVIDSIQGTSFLAIVAALPAFERHKPELSDYRIRVARAGSSLVVIFSDKADSGVVRGSGGKRPSFEVQMDAKDLRVVRSNYVR